MRKRGRASLRSQEEVKKLARERMKNAAKRDEKGEERKGGTRTGRYVFMC